MTEPEQEEPEYIDPDPRLPRGYLISDVDRVCRDFHNKILTLPEGKYLTAWEVGTFLIAETDGCRKRPSVGAITNVFKRFEKAGYATFRKTPRAFMSLTPQAILMPSWNIFVENFGEDGPDNSD